MQDIIDSMAQNSFVIKEIEASGKIVRFVRDTGRLTTNGSAWYIAFQNHARRGDVFHICVYGDWKDPDADYIFCNLTNQNKEDKAFIKKKLEEAQRKRAEEQKKVWDEAAEECRIKWDSILGFNGSEYLDKKMVDALGVKSEGGVLYVPFYDLDGKLHSLQTIKADGEKRFWPGGRTKGNFFLIGDLKHGTEILACEGYATGASLHAATGLPVLVCFYASNLPEVCRLFPDSQITICGDDDIFNPEDKGGNAGRRYAALSPVARSLFPKFASLEGQPTDFNDLHTREGLEAVKNQVLSDEVEKNFVIALGHNGSMYYYTSSSNRQIVQLTREGHTKNSLRDLMSNDYWAAHYPKSNSEEPDWDKIADTLMLKCRAKGIFDDNAVRGTGVWKDGETFLIHCGDSLFYNGKKHSLDSIKSEHIYEIGRRFEPPTVRPFTRFETYPVLSALKNISWASQDSHKLLAGWLVCAPLGGALEWRPHVWITGGSGTGKTTIVGIVKQFVKKISYHFQGPTTEAGIRQTIKSDSKCVVFDEFETDDEESGNRVKHALELMRQASSETEGQVAKGSPTGQAIFYRPRFCALVSSIRVQLVNEADRNRFSVLDLERAADSAAFDKLKVTLLKINKNFADQFFSRNFNLLPVLRKNIEVFWDVLRDDYSARIGQQYGTLLAGYWLIEHDEVIAKEEAKKVCSELDLQDARLISNDREETECIEWLIRKNVRLSLSSGIEEKSFSEMIVGTWHLELEGEFATKAYIGHLERYGIRIEEGSLYIAQRHPELFKVFRGTRWASGWSKSMARIKGAENNVNMRIGGPTTKCTKIPLDEIFGTSKGEVPPF